METDALAKQTQMEMQKNMQPQPQSQLQPHAREISDEEAEAQLMGYTNSFNEMMVAVQNENIEQGFQMFKNAFHMLPFYRQMVYNVAETNYMFFNSLALPVVQENLLKIKETVTKNSNYFSSPSFNLQSFFELLVVDPNSPTPTEQDYNELLDVSQMMTPENINSQSFVLNYFAALKNGYISNANNMISALQKLENNPELVAKCLPFMQELNINLFATQSIINCLKNIGPQIHFFEIVETGTKFGLAFGGSKNQKGGGFLRLSLAVCQVLFIILLILLSESAADKTLSVDHYSGKGLKKVDRMDIFGTAADKMTNNPLTIKLTEALDLCSELNPTASEFCKKYFSVEFKENTKNNKIEFQFPGNVPKNDEERDSEATEFTNFIEGLKGTKEEKKALQLIAGGVFNIRQMNEGELGKKINEAIKNNGNILDVFDIRRVKIPEKAQTPTSTPTNTPPTSTPSQQPSDTPSQQPSDTPSQQPSDTPSSTPSNTPSGSPTLAPTAPPVFSKEFWTVKPIVSKNQNWKASQPDNIDQLNQYFKTNVKPVFVPSTDFGVWLITKNKQIEAFKKDRGEKNSFSSPEIAENKLFPLNSLSTNDLIAYTSYESSTNVEEATGLDFLLLLKVDKDSQRTVMKTAKELYFMYIEQGLDKALAADLTNQFVYRATETTSYNGGGGLYKRGVGGGWEMTSTNVWPSKLMAWIISLIFTISDDYIWIIFIFFRFLQLFFTVDGFRYAFTKVTTYFLYYFFGAYPLIGNILEKKMEEYRKPENKSYFEKVVYLTLGAELSGAAYYIYRAGWSFLQLFWDQIKNVVLAYYVWGSATQSVLNPGIKLLNVFGFAITEFNTEGPSSTMWRRQALNPIILSVSTVLDGIVLNGFQAFMLKGAYYIFYFVLLLVSVGCGPLLGVLFYYITKKATTQVEKEKKQNDINSAVATTAENVSSKLGSMTARLMNQPLISDGGTPDDAAAEKETPSLQIQARSQSVDPRARHAATAAATSAAPIAAAAAAEETEFIPTEEDENDWKSLAYALYDKLPSSYYTGKTNFNKAKEAFDNATAAYFPNIKNTIDLTNIQRYFYELLFKPKVSNVKEIGKENYQAEVRKGNALNGRNMTPTNRKKKENSIGGFIKKTRKARRGNRKGKKLSHRRKRVRVTRRKKLRRNNNKRHHRYTRRH
jgi:hypothetical protein